MKKYVFVVLIIFLFSCKQGDKRKDKELDKKTIVQINCNMNDSVVNNSSQTSVNKKKRSLKANPFVVISNDTISIIENGKVFGVTVNGDSIFSYKLFQVYDDETDFGKTFLCVRNIKFDLYWKKELDNYSKITYSNKYVIISDVNAPYINFYDLITGNLEKKLEIEFIVDDSNEFVADDNNLFISCHNENGELDKVLMIQFINEFVIKVLDIDLKGFYFLKKIDSNSIVLQNSEGDIVEQLN